MTQLVHLKKDAFQPQDALSVSHKINCATRPTEGTWVQLVMSFIAQIVWTRWQVENENDSWRLL